MKKIVFFLCFLFSLTSINAQDVYIVNEKKIQLKTAVNGNLDLLWNIIDNEYRYFVKNESNTIIELKNTKKDKKYQEEYKDLLGELTNGSMPTNKLRFTLYDLTNFVDDYNSKVNPDYQSLISRSKILLRLSVFGGITNSPFITNIDNVKTPLFGTELEVVEGNRISRHAVFMQLKHVLEHDDLNYSTTELALGYRFRFVNAETFSLYGNVKFATLNFSKATIIVNNNGTLNSQDISETAFDVPFIFGIGADIRVSENSFITLAYNELFALLLDNQGNFSTDFSVGYKFNL
ncbi:outer membrane beta-barrel protein [Ichthyenterobacterium magnum]|uniref:Outer membrane protein beta-barrel domain-containing protein n=1 Tax=Ichthyenterobacterium magnum TaxID=1230530 RepID=A0A420DW76_9FLAO|nr:hypothetical protein [Ichthyenterobacterium magnum]RKE98465.1 hypothetical protein BXY80_0553 [Ichthyenterobacterium magnum]